MKLLKEFSLVLAAMLAVVSVSQADEQKVQKNLEAALPGLAITSVEKSQIDGLYRVETSAAEVLFANADASFFVAGELFGIDGGKIVNLSEKRKGKARVEQLSTIKASEKIVFPAEGDVKARITVFTDIDCGYCRKLHREVPRMNELGIEVSYLAYPRAGIGSQSYKKIVSAWCAEDPLQAMTDAKAGKQIPEKSCENPVAKQFNMGMTLGVSGTPAILLEDGTLVPGYMPADQLAQGLGIL